MQQVVSNILVSKARPMVALRYILGVVVCVVGVVRLRLIFLLLGSTNTYKIRDTLTYYLMAKAISLGESPYQNLSDLANRFFGISHFLPHAAPCTPFMAILSLPLLLFSVEKAYIAWFWLEMMCLVLISIMLPILLKGKRDWKLSILFMFLLLSWYPVMVDLILGQLTILLTMILLAALLSWKRERRILTGMLIGLTVAIKMYTWPLVLYYALKKDWRTFLSSCCTVAGLNLIGLIVLGPDSFGKYYLQVTTQVSAVYHSFLKNYSIWSIGYRLFEGTQAPDANFITSPPLINLPQIAGLTSAVFAVVFLAVGLIWATRLKSNDFAYSIMICVAIAVSPITWDHYYLMLIIGLVVLASYLSQQSFPYKITVPFLILALLLFLLNEYSPSLIFALNGGVAVIQANHNQITFASSLLEVIPIVELVALATLLWRIGIMHTRGVPVSQPV
jgi:hypothetical protein